MPATRSTRSRKSKVYQRGKPDNKQRAMAALIDIDSGKNPVEMNERGEFDIDEVMNCVRMHAEENLETLGPRTTPFVESALALARRSKYVEIDYATHTMRLKRRGKGELRSIREEAEREEYDTPRDRHRAIARLVLERMRLGKTRTHKERDIDDAERESRIAKLEGLMRQYGVPFPDDLGMSSGSDSDSEAEELELAHHNNLIEAGVDDSAAGPSSNTHEYDVTMVTDEVNENPFIVSNPDLVSVGLGSVSPMRRYPSQNPEDAYPTPDAGSRNRSSSAVPATPPSYSREDSAEPENHVPGAYIQERDAVMDENPFVVSSDRHAAPVPSTISPIRSVSCKPVDVYPTPADPGAHRRSPSVAPTTPPHTHDNLDQIAGPSLPVQESGVAVISDGDPFTASSSASAVPITDNASPVRRLLSRNPTESYPTPDSAPRHRSPFVPAVSPPPSPSPAPSRGASVPQDEGMEVDAGHRSSEGVQSISIPQEDEIPDAELSPSQWEQRYNRLFGERTMVQSEIDNLEAEKKKRQSHLAVIESKMVALFRFVNRIIPVRSI